ncbi:MAG: kinase/pyrophosphorylase [bacterium]|nr:kinase/pyrophosphorylase [bacterium]
MMENSNNGHERKRYVFLVSDATGKTCWRVVNAALKQFKATEVVKKNYANVRSLARIEEIMSEAASKDGIVIFTMVSPEARQKITELGRSNAVPTVDVMGPLLTRFSDLLELSPLAQPGLGRQLDGDYFKRIEALDYTIKHDDALRMATLDQAEIVLLGVSRTTKTPVSIYLSYRGWKVANIPIVYGQGLPKELKDVDPKRVVALTVKPTRLQLIRMERERHLTDKPLDNYTELERVQGEVKYGLGLYRDYGCPVLDVSYKSIEETSTEVMRIIYSNFHTKKGKDYNQEAPAKKLKHIIKKKLKSSG